MDIDEIIKSGAEITPLMFAAMIAEIATMQDEEVAHFKADGLLCHVLTQLGYGDGVKTFDEMGKWYA